MASLLIYIPTYNRPTLLRVQLEALQPQVVNRHGRVRLVVADNHSPSLDEAGQFPELASADWLEFHRRPSNIQVNGNILQGFLMAKRDEYLWILADDTLVTENAVGLILDAIDTLSPDIIGLTLPGQVETPKILNWGPSAISDVVSQYSWGLISSAIYSGEYFLDHAFQAFFFHNSSFPHLGVLFSALKSRGSMNVTWLETREIHGENFIDGPSDYSLAVVGFPQLFSLVDPFDRKRMLVDWLKANSAGFAFFSRQQPLSAAASLQILNGAGLQAKILLILGRFESWFRCTRAGIWVENYILGNPRILNRLKSSRRLMFKTRP